MRLASPLWLFTFIGIIVLYVIWVLRSKKQEAALKANFSPENLERMGLKEKNPLYGKLYRYSLLLFLSFLIIAQARPQFGARKSSQLVSDKSVVFLVDLSRSMLTKDISPSRLDLMKFEIIKTLKSLSDIRVGLIAFAGSVDLIAPLTEDLSAVEDYTNSLNTDGMVVQGTEIKTALDEARGFFKRTSDAQSEDEFKKESKVIVLFSDGEDHQTYTVDYVKKMAKENYTVFSVGVGTEEGGYVPEAYGSNIFIRDQSGQPVLSKPSFTFLKSIAREGKGSFFYLDPISDLAPKLKKALDEVEGSTSSSRSFVVENEIYQIFLILSLLSLCATFVFWRLRG